MSGFIEKRDEDQDLIRSEIQEICPMERLPRMVLLNDPPQLHELKCWPSVFEPTLQGRKTFEVRKMDRDFTRGDKLRLREWAPVPEEYTGREVTVEVTYILEYRPELGIPKGYCVMAIVLVPDEKL